MLADRPRGAAGEKWDKMNEGERLEWIAEGINRFAKWRNWEREQPRSWALRTRVVMAGIGQRIKNIFGKGDEPITGIRDFYEKFLGGELRNRPAQHMQGETALNKPAKPGSMAEAMRSVAPDLDAPRVSSRPYGSANVLRMARESFLALPKEVVAADGKRVLLHNPDQSWFPTALANLDPIEKRASMWRPTRTAVTPNTTKVRWIPMIGDTLERAQLRVKDQVSGNDLYIRKYSDEAVHVVVVSRAGRVVGQMGYDAGLVTHLRYATQQARNYAR